MVRYTEEAGKLVCAFQERLDTENCTAFEGGLIEKVSQLKDKTVVFDLTNVNYVSSLFLGICMRAFKELGSGKFLLVSVSPNIKKVFKISGLDNYLEIH